MVEVVTQYKTFDGKLFDSMSKAAEWENKIDLARAIKSMFPDPSSLGMGDYYRVPLTVVNNARSALSLVLKTEVGAQHNAHIAYFRNGGRGGFIGRLLCDSESPFYSALVLLESIDDEGRLFNQPYYATHPDEAKNEIPY